MMKLLTYEQWGVTWRHTINWKWIKYRWQQRHCKHIWVPAETKKNPHYGCARNDCAVWRWNPITSKIVNPESLTIDLDDN